MLAQRVFIDGGRLPNGHEQPARVAAHVAEVALAAQGAEPRLSSAELPSGSGTGLRGYAQLRANVGRELVGDRARPRPARVVGQAARCRARRAPSAPPRRCASDRQHQPQPRGAGVDGHEIAAPPSAGPSLVPAPSRCADCTAARPRLRARARRLQIEAHDEEAEQAVVQREVREPDGNSSSGRVACVEVQHVVEQARRRSRSRAARRAASITTIATPVSTA